MTNKEQELYYENEKLGHEIKRVKKDNVELYKENERLKQIIKLQNDLI